MNQKVNLGPSVYEAMREKAVNYSFRPREHIDEVRLAKELGVSRTPVREALYRLVSEGLVVFKPKKGFFGRPFGLAQIRDSYQIRSALEVLSIQLCCSEVSDDQLITLSTSCEEMNSRMKTASLDELVRLDEQFHEEIAFYSGNLELLKMIKEMNTRIRYMRMVSFENKDFFDDMIEGHTAIVAALSTRDSKAATALMEGHISQTLDGLSNTVKEGVSRIFMSDEE